MSSRSIRVVVYVTMPFLFKAEWYFIVCRDVLRIHSPIDGLSGYFHILAIVTPLPEKMIIWHENQATKSL